MINLENLLLIDIETVPLYKNFSELSADMQRLWTKKAMLIDPESDDVGKTFSERGGIYAEFGKIICIGLGYFIRTNNSYTLKVKSIAGDDESKVLLDFVAIANKFFNKPEKQFCGHNIREFDIPYICRRSLIKQVTMPIVLTELQNKKPWENPMLDTLQFWKFGEYKNFTSIDLLSTVLDIPSPKEDIDGSDVAQVYWQENNLKRIATYCNKDVVTVAQVLMRLQAMELLHESQIEYIES